MCVCARARRGVCVCVRAQRVCVRGKSATRDVSERLLILSLLSGVAGEEEDAGEDRGQQSSEETSPDRQPVPVNGETTENPETPGGTKKKKKRKLVTEEAGEYGGGGALCGPSGLSASSGADLTGDRRRQSCDRLLISPHQKQSDQRLRRRSPRRLPRRWEAVKKRKGRSLVYRWG